MNRRQLFFSTAKAALATAFTGVLFRRGAHAQAPTAVKFPDSTVLPTPTPPFAGVIEPNLVDSTPGWPPTVAPPAGAPNVLLILIDDAGYGANSAFGGIVPTPALESLARRGLRYTQMHNTALCSPTRAALLTGRNHHAVGFGTVAEAAVGYPGYDSIIPPETAHLAMTLKENGYATAWFGKNHNVPTWEATPAGPFTNWPTGQGYDYFYGFVGGDTSQWQPGNLFRNTTPIHPYNGHPGWNLNTAMAEGGDRVHQHPDRDQPEAAVVHPQRARRHARTAPSDPGVGREDQRDAPLRRRLEQGHRAHLRQSEAARRGSGERQIAALAGRHPPEMGDFVGRSETALSAPNRHLGGVHGLHRPRDRPHRRDHREARPVRQHADHLCMGRQRHERRGVAQRHAERGCLFQRRRFYRRRDAALDPGLGHRPHLQPLCGALGLCDGHALPLVQAGRLASRRHAHRHGGDLAQAHHGCGRHPQFHHVIDIAPTILDAIGIPQPTAVNGIAQRPYDGVSMVYSWDNANAGAGSTRKTQYFEILGNRAIYHDGWMANTIPAAPPWEGVNAHVPTDVLDGYKWELFNLAEDPTQTNDLSAREPERLRAMQELWLIEATRNQVLPMNNSQVPAARPGPAAGRTQFVYTAPMTSTQFAAAPSILNCSYRITAEIEVPQGGANGVLVTQGGRFAGYALYLKDGKPTFTINLIGLERPKWQSNETLPPGKHTIVFDWKMDPQGLAVARGGAGTLSVNGKEAAQRSLPKTVPFIWAWDETFDVGLDTGTSMDDADYQVPFPFTGTIGKIVFDLGESSVSPQSIHAMMEELAKKRDR